MGLRLAAVTVLSGCSFIYNPSNINGQSDAAGPDTEFVADVDPTMLKLDYAFPATVYEGAGQGNSRAALVVIHGSQIASGATVTVVPASGPATQIAVSNMTLATDHNWIAFTVAVPIDKMQDATGMYKKSPLDLTVTVDNGGGNSVTMPTGSLTLTFLDQLYSPLPSAAAVDASKVYSEVNVTSLQSFTAGSALGRVVVRSVSGITFSQGIAINGASANPGPGGCSGGAVASSGNSISAGDSSACTSGAGGGTSAGGNPGGYGGDAQMSIFANATPGGGGGGGQTAGLLGGAAGGGGAGMIELVAGGDLTVSNNTGSSLAIAAIGGFGTNAGLGGGGGGGAGGSILLRSGATLSTGTIAITGGTGGTPNGMNGLPGHIRYDAASGSVSNSTYTGPMFKAAPYISLDAMTAANALSIIGLAGAAVSGQAYDKDLDAPTEGQFGFMLSGAGTATPQVTLSDGYNKVCVAVPNGNVIQHDEAGNCVEIAYLPGPH